MTTTILLTGGLGYIGSHIACDLLLKGFTVIVIDNLKNSSMDMFYIIQNETNNNSNLFFYKVDLTSDIDKLEKIFQTHNIHVVIHLAGLKSVGESTEYPLLYYETNMLSTINLLKIMEKNNCFNLVFSSSSTVYGNALAPYTEKTQTGIGITNAYGRSKYFQEELLMDIYNSNKLWNIVILRYFNPISQRSSLMRENPFIPNNLFPYLVKVYKGELKQLKVFGNDWNTPDGTCIRDFIHVVDLAEAHVVVSSYLIKKKISSLKIYNVGTGNGISVQQLLDAFERINNTKLNYEYTEKRNGDLERSYGDVSLIEKELGWKTKYNIEDMVKINC